MGETFLLLYLREIGLIARSFLIDMKYYDVRSRIQATHQPIISMVSLFLTSVYRSLSLSFCLRSVSKAGTLEPPRSTEVFDLEAETGQTHRCLHQETILAWKGKKNYDWRSWLLVVRFPLFFEWRHTDLTSYSKKTHPIYIFEGPKCFVR